MGDGTVSVNFRLSNDEGGRFVTHDCQVNVVANALLKMAIKHEHIPERVQRLVNQPQAALAEALGDDFVGFKSKIGPNGVKVKKK